MRDRWSLPSGVLPGQEPFSARKPYLGATTPPPAQGSAKPYLDSPESFVGFMTAPVRHLKDIIEKESAFEKPYMHGTEGYPQMHVDLPNPDWGSYHVPGFSGLVPKSNLPKGTRDTTSSCRYCIIICYGDDADNADECPKIYSWCHIGIACTLDPQLGAANPGDVQWQIEGPVLGVLIDSLDGIDIYADWDKIKADDDGNKKATFIVTLVDGLKHRCTETVELECKGGCDCATEPNVAWDAGSSIETIARNHSGTIAITGGCPPYDWNVSGTGFSLDNAQTTELSNTLHAAGSACGTATITVTDDCGDTATGYVRCDTGTWVLVGSYCCSGNQDYPNCNGSPSYTPGADCGVESYLGCECSNISGKYLYSPGLVFYAGYGCPVSSYPYAATCYSSCIPGVTPCGDCFTITGQDLCLSGWTVYEWQCS